MWAALNQSSWKAFVQKWTSSVLQLIMLYNANTMAFLDKLPTVISCCFCCFLRAGTVLISIVSFIIGLFLAPNINHTPGLWQLTSMSDVKSLGLEKSVHMMLGIISIFLCIISVLLLIGALCNFPKLLEVYQWGAMVYCAVVCILFAVLASYCAAVHGDCLAVGLTMLFLIIANILCTIYFVIVVNSLRVTSIFISENKVEL